MLQPMEDPKLEQIYPEGLQPVERIQLEQGKSMQRKKQQRRGVTD